jgi:UDP-N-acetylmuramoylalanine--D-glutamate ligase
MAGRTSELTQRFAGQRVVVLGLGIEGQDLARFFCEQGASVLISDAKPAEALSTQLAAIADLAVDLSLGDNRPEIVDDADLLAVTQGAPLDLPLVRRARARGIPITSRTRLFFELCPGPIAGISGSSGKTTTTSLVGAIFAASGRPHIVGGNIGGPLLTRLSSLDASTWVVLEVSHTQLQLTDRSPHVACLTNVTPNHLDRFTWDEYVGLKRNLIAHQTAADLAVLNFDNQITRAMSTSTAARLLHFSIDAEIPGDGAFVRDGHIVARQGDATTPVLALTEIPLRGRHNVENVACATAVAMACGLGIDAVRAAVASFRAVPHRLELVAESEGVAYYNDSIATAPERTLAGMRSFSEPLVLLLGGRDKHLPLDELAAEAAVRCRAIICFGEAGPLLAEACQATPGRGRNAAAVRTVPTLEEAVALARHEAKPGDVVLLSPACTSFDAYDNFERRGEAFRELVRAFAPTGSPRRSLEAAR